MTSKSFGCAALLLLLAGIVYLVILHPLVMGLAAAALVLFVIWRARVFVTGLKRAVQEAAQAAGQEVMPGYSQQGGRFWRPAGSSSPSGQLGSLVYVGEGLASVAGQMPEPALINPELAVDPRISECRSARLEHWPSYATCSPAARAGYLTWLSTGRNNPRADIGYVFLYFYGLERRALHDMLHEEAAIAERPALIAEIERLLSIYGDNSSFCRYATSLRNLLMALELPSSAYLQPPATPAEEPPTPADWVALGMCAADGAPLPVAWAYRWVLHDSVRGPGVGAQRAPGELEALFGEIYRRRHGEGLVLSPARVKLRLTHRPASPSFLQEVRIATDLPDVSGLQRAREQLAEVLSQARGRLARYSRKLAKDPSAAGTAAGLLELPFSLWPAAQRKGLEALAQRVRAQSQPLVLPFTQLQAALPPPPAALTRSGHRGLCEALASLSVGMEPDPRFDGAVPGADARVVLFAEEPESGSGSPSARYLGAAAMLELAAAVAGPDGHAGEAERALMLEHVGAIQGLTESERRRLRALLRRVSGEPPRAAGLKRRLAALDARGREVVGDFLVEVARADRTITPQEIRSLQHSFTLLGLDAQGVFAKLHAAETAAPDSPAQSAPGLTQEPNPKQPVPAGVSLDTAKIAHLQADSEAVASLLESVFTPELEEEPQAAAPLAGEAPGVLGLDAAALAFLKTLLTKSDWSRAELTALARDSGVPLDGVLERLNEAAFEQLDMPLFEEGDPLVINPQAAAAITA